MLPDSIHIKQSQPTNTQNQNMKFMGYPKMGIILLFLCIGFSLYSPEEKDKRERRQNCGQLVVGMNVLYVIM